MISGFSILGLGIFLLPRTLVAKVSEESIVKVDATTRRLAQMPLERNPIYLDAIKHSLKPTRIISLFSNPQFQLPYPPAIPSFMIGQVINAASTKSGMIHPLFIKYALAFADAEDVDILDACRQGIVARGKTCRPCHKLVIVKGGGSGSAKACKRLLSRTKTESTTTSTKDTKSTTGSTTTSVPVSSTSSTTRTPAAAA